MKLLSQKRHAIDFLFPVTVFFVFTISALTVILLAARIYQSTTDDSQRNYTSGTALSYLTEKLRQTDREDGIFLDELDGTQAVVLRQETADASYLTYLYAWDGQLRELYVKEGTTLSPSAGKSILPVKRIFCGRDGESGDHLPLYRYFRGNCSRSLCHPFCFPVNILHGYFITLCTIIHLLMSDGYGITKEHL